MLAGLLYDANFNLAIPDKAPVTVGDNVLTGAQVCALPGETMTAPTS